MDRRQFCAALAALTAGIALAGCGQDRPLATPTFRPDETRRRLAGLDAKGVIATLVAGRLEGEALAPGLFVYYGERGAEPKGPLTVSYQLSPGYHRVSYRVYASEADAQDTYARAISGYADDPRGTPRPLAALPYPSSALTYDDTGVASILVGQVIISEVASGTNARLFTALALGSVAYLEQSVTAEG